MFESTTNNNNAHSYDRSAKLAVGDGMPIEQNPPTNPSRPNRVSVDKDKIIYIHDQDMDENTELTDAKSTAAIVRGVSLKRKSIDSLPIAVTAKGILNSHIVSKLASLGWKFSEQKRYFYLAPEDPTANNEDLTTVSYGDFMNIVLETTRDRNGDFDAFLAEHEVSGRTQLCLDTLLMKIEERALLSNIEKSIEDQTKRPNKRRRSEEQMERVCAGKEPKTTFVRAMKLLPKYIGENEENEVFTKETVKLRILDKILQEESVKSSSSPLLDIRVEDVEGDPMSINFAVEGRADLVEMVRKKVVYIISVEVTNYNLQALLSDELSQEIDLLFDVSSPKASIGTSILDLNKSKNHAFRGMWITRAEPGLQMDKILGRAAANRGAAILKVNGVSVNTLKELKDAWMAAKQKANTSRDDNKTTIVTVCVARNADLSHLDHSKILPGSKSPRRRGKIIEVQRTIPVSDSGRDSRVDSLVDVEKRRTEAMGNNFKGGEKMSENKSVLKMPGQQLHTEKAKANYRFYKYFVDKFQKACEIEYANVGIKKQTINKAMWDQHKQLFGERCDDNCICPSNLRGLTERVIPDFLARQAKVDKEWTNPSKLKEGDSPVGFVNRFGPKFYEKVRKEFPSETPAKCLERLGELWKFHREERRFGNKCKKDCACGEGWTTFLRKMRSVSSGQKLSHSSSQRRASSGTVSSTPANGPSAPESLRPENAPVPVKKRSSGFMLKSLTSTQQQKEFNVVFDPAAPLGFFCITEEGTASTVCKITSVNPQSQRPDTRIQNGTIILASAAIAGNRGMGERIPLRSHSELKQRYEAAKLRGSNTKLRLWFSNAEAMSPAGVPRGGVESNWSASGAWQGNSLYKGWPGGASMIQKTQNKSITEARRSKKGLDEEARQALREKILAHRKNTSQDKPSPSATMQDRILTLKHPSQRNTTHKTLAEHAGVKNGKEASHKEVLTSTSKSTFSSTFSSNRADIIPVLRPPGHKSSGNRVKFSNRLKETRVYEPESTTHSAPDAELEITTPPEASEGNNFSTRVAAAVAMDVPIQKRRSDELTNAIINKDFKDVIHLLRGGAYANQKDSKKRLPLDYVKELIVNLEKEEKNSLFQEESLKDLSLKKNVLKIYVTAEHVINMARHIKEWVNVELVPKNVSNLALTPQGREHPSTDFLFCVVNIDGRMQDTTMPLIPFSSSSPDWSNVQNCPKYKLSYNKRLEFSYKQKREISVDLVKGSSKTTNMNATLGTWKEPVENIKEAVEKEGSGELSGQLSRTELLESGLMSVKFKSASPQCQFFRRKRVEVARELTKLTGWIKSFREEVNAFDATDNLLDANISLPSCGGVSLLHAAVYVADLNLVNELLSLRADPNKNSIVGSAVNLAVNLAAEKPCTSNQDVHGTLIDILNSLNQSSSIHRENKHKQHEEIYAATENSNDNNEPAANQAEENHGPLSETQMPPAHDRPYHIQDPRAIEKLASKVQSILSKQSLNSSATTSSQMADCKRAGQKDNRWDQQMQHQETSTLQNAINQTTPHAQVTSWANTPSLTPGYPPIQHTLQKSSDDSPQVTGKGNLTEQTRYSPFGTTIIGMPYSSGHAGQVKIPDLSMHGSDLPIISPIDWIEGKGVRCAYFNKPSGCEYGAKCFRAHVNGPLGSLLDASEWHDSMVIEENGAGWSVNNVHVKSATDSRGKIWFTAAFLDPSVNIIHYAERGSFAQQSSQGIYWYPTGDAAIIALKRVVIISQRANNNSSHQLSNFAGQVTSGIYGPAHQVAQTEHRSEGHFGFDHDHHYDALFKRTLGADLQSIYVKIFPGNELRKRVWEIYRDKSGLLVSAVFKSPATQENGATYPSAAVPAATLKDGRWWYDDDKAAKAGAFLNFLISAAGRGLITKDFKSTPDGKRLFKY